MTKESAEYIRRALSSYKSDDLERAERAFANCTPIQMKEQYGASGKTRQQILDEYRQHRAKHNKAVAELEGVFLEQ